MSSTLPTTRSPAPIAYRISVSAGVRDTIFCGSAASSSVVPSSSVRLTGNAGPGDAAAAADGGTVAVAGGTSAPVASGGVLGRVVAAGEQAARTRTVAAVAIVRAARMPRPTVRRGSGRIVPVPFSRR
jgi:hypothetical protein